MSQHVIPFADYRPIAWAEARDDATNPTVIVLHLTASEATSQYGYFANPANKACSNTHVARDGHVEQYIRGDRLSAAESYGSSRAFSIETQGADAGGRWTPQQCESIAQIIAWAHRTYGIPLRLMTSSAPGETGVGWHRLGVDGNWPSMPNILAGRVQRGGGEVWSSHFGKVCPGDNRIKQIPAILDRAIAIVNGADTPGGFLMALSDEKQEKAFKAITETRTISEQTRTKVTRLEEDQAARREADLKHQRASAAREVQLQKEVAGLTEAVRALATSQGLPVEQILDVVREAISGITITVAAD